MSNLCFLWCHFLFAPQVLDGCLQLLRERRVLDGLLAECKDIASTIQSLVAQLQDSKARGGEEAAETEREEWKW